jgi:hypothetical protein
VRRWLTAGDLRVTALPAALRAGALFGRAAAQN